MFYGFSVPIVLARGPRSAGGLRWFVCYRSSRFALECAMGTTLYTASGPRWGKNRNQTGGKRKEKKAGTGTGQATSLPQSDFPYTPPALFFGCAFMRFYAMNRMLTAL